MFLTNQTKSSKLTFLLPGLVLLAAGIGEARGQQGGLNRPSMRDQVRSIQQADMDRLLRWSLPSKTDPESSRAAVMKQIREDFRDLQGLNNRMMAEAWATETLDYPFISEMVSRIRGKATRLKSNLNLPERDTLEKELLNQNPANDRDFRAALMILDRSIMSFVTNPVFKKPNTIEVTEATRARKDLESVIELSASLKKVASKLAKVSRFAK